MVKQVVDRIYFHHGYVAAKTNLRRGGGPGWYYTQAHMACVLFQAGEYGMSEAEFLFHAKTAMKFGGHDTDYIHQRCQGIDKPKSRSFLDSWGPQAPGVPHRSGKVQRGEHMFTVTYKNVCDCEDKDK